MATTTPNFGWSVPTSSDLVKNGATAIETLGDSIDASLVDLKGGTTDQVLAKNSNTDMDFKWVSDATGMTNPMTTTGDVIYSSSGSTPARLGIGTAGQVLQVNSGATAPEWAAPAGGGKVLQVVHASTSTETASSSTAFATTNLTATITPTSASSQVLVLVSQNGCLVDTQANQGVKLQLVRGATVISAITDRQSYNSGNNFSMTGASFNWLDSPATTSATTYKTEFARYASGGGTVYVQSYNSVPTVSTITLMEIGA